MKYGLSPKQNKVLDFIKSYMKDKPVAPNYTEIMAATGFNKRTAYIEF